MSALLIPIAAFIGVAAIVGALALLLRGDDSTRVEDRLTMLTAGRPAAGKGPQQSSVLAQPLDTTQNVLSEFLARFRNLSLMFVQADTSLTPTKFFLVSAAMAFAGSVAGALTGISPIIVPVFTILAGILPLLWLMLRRKKRLKAFARQLPDALELIARALRAGHSLASGF